MKSLKQVRQQPGVPSSLSRLTKRKAAVTLWRRHRAVYSKFQNRW